MANIKDMINALDSSVSSRILTNDADTWRRIQAKDSFDELGLNSEELKGFIKEWTESNDYNNIA